MNFDKAFNLLMQCEGAFSNDPQDLGGKTKYGISQSAYPNMDIASITLDQAKNLYENGYWLPCHCDQLPDAIRYDVFDAAVNSGIRQSCKWLQMALGVATDGILGPVSLSAAQAADGLSLRLKFNAARLSFMTTLPTWDHFGKGWARRIADNLAVQP